MNLSILARSAISFANLLLLPPTLSKLFYKRNIELVEEWDRTSFIARDILLLRQNSNKNRRKIAREIEKP